MILRCFPSRDSALSSEFCALSRMCLVGGAKPWLALLDLMQQIQETRQVPVVFLSAHGQDELVAGALDFGAADYVVMPFSPAELVARIRAALSRQAAPEPVDPYLPGDLVIDYTGRRVTLAGRQVRLTAIEHRTLAELSLNEGRVLTYGHLRRRVWGVDGEADKRPMRAVIGILRRRLGDDAQNLPISSPSPVSATGWPGGRQRPGEQPATP